MSKKIINSRAREMIIQVDNYFTKERDDSKLLIQSLKSALCQAYNSKEIMPIPKELVKDVLKTLQNTGRVTDRVASATGMAQKTVCKLRREHEAATASGSKMKTAKKHKCQSMEYFDESALMALRNIIHSIYTVRKEIPTMRKIMAAAKESLDYPGGETTLRKIIKRDLGYQFKRCQQKGLYLIESPQIQAMRAKYIRRLKNNDTLGEFKNPVVYINEVCIDTPSTEHNPGLKWIILHAGSETTGFVDNTLLMFQPESKTGECNDQIDADNYTDWVTEKLMPNIPSQSIIVIDNAPYHSIEENKPPSMNCAKEVMIDWLQNHNIQFSNDCTKSELYLLIKQHKPPKIYKVDKLLSENSHEALRLPPYNSDLNPMKGIWNLVKERVSEKNAEQSASNMESIVVEVMATITPDEWENEVNNVKRLREQFWCNDRMIEELSIINTADDSEYETTETDSDVNEETSEIPQKKIKLNHKK